MAFSTGAQIKAARALLGWQQTDLADAAGLHPKAIAYWERKESIADYGARGWMWPAGMISILEAFEDAGVIPFTEPAPGVMLCP